jgi:hypothetical protein
MYIRAFGLIIAVVYVFGWFTPLGYFNFGEAIGDFFTIFGGESASNVSSVSTTVNDFSRDMFGDTYAAVDAKSIGGVSYLMLVAGIAFAFVSWTKNWPLSLIASIVMFCVPIYIYFNYIGTPAWGIHLLFGTSVVAIVYAFVSKRFIKPENPFARHA